MNYPNNHKHKFVKKDADKAFPVMMCEECEFELDVEYYEGYVLPLESELKEWQVKCAFLEGQVEEANNTIARQLSFIAGQKLELEEAKISAEARGAMVDTASRIMEQQRKDLKELERQNTTLHDMLDKLEAKHLFLERSILDLSHPNIKSLMKELESYEAISGKMADGWCLVSPEDFEKLKTLKDQNARLRGTLSQIANDTLMDGGTRKLCRDALQQLSNQGDVSDLEERGGEGFETVPKKPTNLKS
jgi:ribosome maturation factor RimP